MKNGKYEYSNACLGSVSFETNGMQGGAAGHGGFLEIRFDTDGGSTALDVEVDGKVLHGVKFVALKFQGDAEIGSAIECFEYLAEQLQDIREQGSASYGGQP